jgi:hypothetical protein
LKDAQENLGRLLKFSCMVCVEIGCSVTLS